LLKFALLGPVKGKLLRGVQEITKEDANLKWQKFPTATVDLCS